MELKETIQLLTNAYGVSGDEFEVSKIAASLLEPYVDKVSVDEFGNVTGYKSCGKQGAPKLLLDAHLDQIGFMVTQVTDDGFLRFVGMGVDQRMLLGSELTVITEQGYLPGVVAAIPPHLQKKGDSKKSVPIRDMVVDIGMTGEQAKKAVRVGDYMTFANDTYELLPGVLCGKAMDDRACFSSIVYALSLLKDKPMEVDLIVVGSTKEELGGHGAQARTWHEKPDFAIAVDVAHAKTDDATATDDVHEFGGGPIVGIGSNSVPRFARRMIAAAKGNDIPYQVEAIPAHSGTNAWSMQLVGEGVTTMVVSIPLKYMHSPVELLRLSDAENTGKLLAAFVSSFDGAL